MGLQPNYVIVVSEAGQNTPLTGSQAVDRYTSTLSSGQFSNNATELKHCSSWVLILLSPREVNTRSVGEENPPEDSSPYSQQLIITDALPRDC